MNYNYLSEIEIKLNRLGQLVNFIKFGSVDINLLKRAYRDNINMSLQKTDDEVVAEERFLAKLIEYGENHGN